MEKQRFCRKTWSSHKMQQVMRLNNFCSQFFIIRAPWTHWSKASLNKNVEVFFHHNVYRYLKNATYTCRQKADVWVASESRKCKNSWKTQKIAKITANRLIKDHKWIFWSPNTSNQVNNLIFTCFFQLARPFVWHINLIKLDELNF